MDYIAIVIGIGDGIGIGIGIGIGNGMGGAAMLVGERHRGQRGGAAYFYIWQDWCKTWKNILWSMFSL